jgi:hypothetical protein
MLLSMVGVVKPIESVCLIEDRPLFGRERGEPCINARSAFRARRVLAIRHGPFIAEIVIELYGGMCGVRRHHAPPL